MLENNRNSNFLYLLSLSRFKIGLMYSGCVNMRGGRGLFIGISNQSETSHVVARVSLRMAPDACSAAPRAPLVFQHGLLTCKVTPRPPHVWPHAWVASIATSRAWPFHLVILCVTPHVMTICSATPRASLATYHSRQLPPRPELIDRATSSFSGHSSGFGLSSYFSTRNQFRIFFNARSDDLSIFK